jgi:integrase
MALYKRGDWWHYEFEVKGQRYRGSTLLKNRQKAQTFADAKRTSIVLGEVGIEEHGPAPNFQKYAEKFADHIRTRHADKPETVSFYLKKLKQLLNSPHFSDVRLDRVDEGLIEKFVLWRRKSVSATSVNRELATLRRMLHLAQEWKDIRFVPKVRLLTGERQREFVLTHEDERRYLAVAPEPLRSLAIVLLDTGLRLGEVLHLRWLDVHFEPAMNAKYGWLHVREGKSKNARRNVPLTNRVAALLKERTESTEGLWVFPGDDPERPMLGTSFAHLHIKVCRPGSGKKRQFLFPQDFVIHSLRHTFCTRLGEAGADAFTIMKLAGHSSVTVSQRYVHPTPEAMERAFDRLEALNMAAARRLKSSPLNPPQQLADGL